LHAAQQIAKAFNIDTADDVQHQHLSVVPATLQSIFDSYLDGASKAATQVRFLDFC
jgi:hypothetical protein